MRRRPIRESRCAAGSTRCTRGSCGFNARPTRREEALVADLASLAAYCRELISAEYNERPVADLRLAGLDPDTMHRATLTRWSTLGVEHLTLDHHDDELQHLLNLARTESREIEIWPLRPFPSPHDHGATICHALNRVSSAFYYLQLRRAAALR